MVTNVLLPTTRRTTAQSFSKVTAENLENQRSEFVHVAIHTCGLVHGCLLQRGIYSDPFKCGRIRALEICTEGEKLVSGRRIEDYFFLSFPHISIPWVTLYPQP